MNIQMLAGSIASLIFTLGTLNMLSKAWRTKDMRSYSGTMLILNNSGNAIYWLYVLSLPAGPIYLMHLFNTVATGLMLVWWVAYRRYPETAKRASQMISKLVTGEMANVNGVQGAGASSPSQAEMAAFIDGLANSN